ncbi:MAG: 4-hydroxythreonine-4-phosphate dehydrogenase PdxA [Akkermansia sp.]|nr:4-hydroxythreonine-4-phosphate dehydrogenase PdxA [Akkermansia sp.]
MSAERPIIGYTLGDQAGIGPEVIRAALAQAPAGAEYRLIGRQIPCTPGCPTEATAQAALEHLELAAEALRTGSIDAVVTAPICKEALHKLGFAYPGQTEFFADRLGVKDFAMCLTGRRLTVALCTTHIALADVPGLLRTEEIVRVGTLLADFLRRTGKERPRIALAGLNPHNGEAGAFGHEEQTLITPALSLLQQTAPYAVFAGPCVPDCVYRDAAQGMYDGIVAPYHDQALIPLKLIDFDNAVNATIGLPRLRVSPDHGTAFGIAGKGIASATSTQRAFEVALRSVR